MKPHGFLPLLQATLLLTACSSQLLEEVDSSGVAGDCRDGTKIFNTFNMTAKSVRWATSKDAKDKAAVLTIDLSFDNATNWPVALSNSGNGVLYSIEYSLSGDSAPVYAPKDTTGVFKNIHKPIELAKPEAGKLIFAAPKANYLLTIERTFSGAPMPGKREDHFASCRIFAT